MIKTFFVAISLTALLSGCSRTSDYTASPGTGGEESFKAACLECHPAVSENPLAFFEIASENANMEYVTNKIHTGELFMPKFPHIQGDELKALAEYVLEHNKAKATN